MLLTIILLETTTTPSNMNCMLMHKQIKVAEVELYKDTAFIQRIGKVFAPEHLPVGVPVKEASRIVLRSTNGGRIAPYPQAVPVCVRRLKFSVYRARKHYLSAAVG